MLDYPPQSGKATADIKEKAKAIRDQVKAGRSQITEFAIIDKLFKLEINPLESILGANVALIPVPRSAPLVKDGVWPSKVIAEALVKHGLGERVLPCLERVYAVKKSAFQTGSSERTTVEEHYQSLGVDTRLLQPERITLIDDVITQGRTMYASARRVHEAFPDAEISAFAFLRTRSFDPVAKIFNPQIAKITYNPRTGKTFVH